jgi:hypothetical protein
MHKMKQNTWKGDKSAQEDKISRELARNHEFKAPKRQKLKKN